MTVCTVRQRCARAQPRVSDEQAKELEALGVKIGGIMLPVFITPPVLIDEFLAYHFALNQPVLQYVRRCGLGRLRTWAHSTAIATCAALCSPAVCVVAVPRGAQ